MTEVTTSTKYSYLKPKYEDLFRVGIDSTTYFLTNYGIYKFYKSWSKVHLGELATYAVVDYLVRRDFFGLNGHKFIENPLFKMNAMIGLLNVIPAMIVKMIGGSRVSTALLASIAHNATGILGNSAIDMFLEYSDVNTKNIV